jgi:WD40 repeat protein
MFTLTLGRTTLRIVRAGLLLLLVGLLPDLRAQQPSPVLQTFKGHDDPVYAVAFSADNKYVATGSFDKSIRIWDAATGKQFRAFAGPQGHTGLVLTLAVSLDGTQLATGSIDNTARTWDFPGETPLRAIDLPAEGLGVALSADGTKSVVALKDGTVKVFNQADGKELYVLKGHEGPVTQVAMTANNTLLVTTGSDRTIRFWNPANGAPLGVYGAHTAPITNLQTRPDSVAAYTSSEDGTVKFWTLPPVAARGLAAPHGAGVTALILSPDGNQLFTASADKTVRQSTFANGAQVKAFGPASGSVLSLSMRADQALLAGGLDNGQVQFWTTADAKDAGKLSAHAGPVTGMAFNAANQLLSVGGDGFLRTWALPLVPTRAMLHPDAVTVAIATADGKRVFTAANDKTIYGWNLAAPATPDRKFSGHPTAITALALKGDATVLVSAGDDGILRFWNATNSQAGDVLLAHTGAVTSLSFTADNTKVLSSGVDGSVRLWQIPAPAVKPIAHPDAVVAAVSSADGNSLVTGSADKQVRVWNLQNFQPKALAGLTQPAGAVAISPNGALVAGGSAEKAVVVWTVADSKEQAKFVNTPAPVQSLAFHADNKTLAAGFADGQITVYDTAMKKDLKTFKAHAGPVTGLTYLPSGDLLSGSADKTIQVWNPADGMSKLKIDAPAPVVGLSLTKDGARVAVVGADKNVKLWTLADKKEAGTFATPAEARGLGISPDGSRVVVAGADNRVRLYGTDGKLVESFAHDGPVAVAGFLPDGKRVFSAGADKTARINASSLLWMGNHAGPVRQMVLNGKGDRVASAGDDKQVILWNAADGKVVKAIPAEAPVSGVAINPDATRLSLSADKSVKLLDLTKDGPPLATFTLPAPVTGLTLNAAGTRLAAGFTAGPANTIQVWDVTPGKELVATPLQVLPDATGAIRGLTFLSDNRTLLTAEADKNSHLIDVPAVSQLKVHDGAVTALSLNANATQAVTSGADKTVKVWDLAMGKTVRVFGPLPAPVTTASFSRDFTQIAAASGKQVKTWNAADGKDIATLDGPADVKALNYNADKTRLATAGADGMVRVWDLAVNKELVFFPGATPGPMETVLFTPNGVNVIAGGADKTATVHTIGIARMLVVGSPVRALTIAAGGASVVTGADDKSVKTWNTGTGALEKAFGGGESIARSVATTKNNLVLGVAGQDKQLRLYTLADAKLVGVVPLPAEPTTLAFRPDSVTATTGGKDGSLTSFNVTFTAGMPLPPEFGQVQLTYKHAAEVTDLAYSVDGNSILSTGLDKKLILWKVPSLAATRNFPHPAYVDAVAWGPDGKTLATGCHDGKLRFFDLVKNAPLKEVNAHPAPAMPPNQPAFPIYCLAWTPDGKQVFTGGLEKNVKLWDMAGGTLVREFKAWKEKDFEQGHKDGVYSLTLSPDGKLLATGSSDKTIKLWNVADGTVARTLTNPNLKPAGPMSPPPSHPGSVYGVRFLENGTKLLSVGGAPRGMGYIAVWNVADGKLLSGEEVPLGTIFSLAVSNDGSKIALGTGLPVRTAGVEANNAYLMKTPGK